MSVRVLQSKSNRQTETVRFGVASQLSFETVTLSASEVSTSIAARIPLPFACKILAAAAVLGGSPAGTASFNIVSGAVAYEGSLQARGTILVTGSGNVTGTDVVTATVAGTPVTTAALTSNFSALGAAQSLAKAINANGTISAIGAAYAFGLLNGAAVVQFFDNTPGTGGNAVTIAAGPSPSPGHLGAVATTPTLTGGTASGSTPVLPPTDTTKTGQVPSNTALSGNALFAADQALLMAADQVQMFYPPQSTAAFDAIFPKASELTLRLVTNGSAAGTLKIVLFVVPTDQMPGQPQQRIWVPATESY